MHYTISYVSESSCSQRHSNPVLQYIVFFLRNGIPPKNKPKGNSWSLSTKTWTTLLVCALLLPILTLKALAHHGIAWVEDGFIEIHGTITAITYANPHPTIEVDVEGEIWRVDLARLTRLERAGLKEDTAKVGDEITALGNRSRDEKEKRLKAVRIVIEKTYDGYPEKIPVDGVAPKAQGWTGYVERLGLVRAIKTSFVTYPVVSAIHVLAIATLFSCVVLMDLRLLGRFASLPQEPFVTLLRRVVLTAFSFAILSGALMFAVRASIYVNMKLFWTKMSLILLAGVNFLVFTLLLDRKRPAGAAPSAGARISATLSMLLWLSVILAGRFLGFV